MSNKKIYIYLLYTTVVTVVVSMVFYVFDNLREDFTSTCNGNVMLLHKELTKVNDILYIYGRISNEIINNDSIGEYMEDNEYAYLLDHFAYDEEKDIFHLDDILSIDVDASKISNITGAGDLSFLENKEDIKTKEVYLSIIMNDDFKTINKKIEASHWVYYTSLNRFISIRNSDANYVTSDDFHYIDEILDMDFVAEGTKEKLANRDMVFWTYPYIDLGGDGLMVTASYPIDYNGIYTGSISVDFMSEGLNNLLDTKYSTFLVDDQGTIIATNMKEVTLSDELVNFDELPLNLKFDDVKNLEYDRVHNLYGSKFMAHKIENTPYVVYQVYLESDYWVDAFIDMIPFLIFTILFVIINVTYIRVRESEGKLKVLLKALEYNQKELDYISRFDQLTNVYNRRGLYGELDKLKEENQYFDLTVMIIDIDHFKKVNDVYGHDAGDEVLVELCKIINSCISDAEIISRFGGEEFLVVSKHATIENSVKLAEHIRSSVEKHQFEIIQNLTISIGVSKISRTDTNESWFKNADNALYEAKKMGRNRICYYEDSEIKAYNN